MSMLVAAFGEDYVTCRARWLGWGVPGGAPWGINKSPHVSGVNCLPDQIAINKIPLRQWILHSSSLLQVRRLTLCCINLHCDSGSRTAAANSCRLYRLTLCCKFSWNWIKSNVDCCKFRDAQNALLLRDAIPWTLHFNDKCFRTLFY